MSKIHYFQRYSTAENTITNNTLQLLARIYEYSIAKLDRLLSDLLELESIGIGIEINQQQRGKDSIPDGIILQRSFKLVVESKVGSGVNVQQLVNHCHAFGDEKLKILMLLTIDPIEKALAAEIVTKIDKEGGAIIFRNVTYRGLCKALEDLFEDYEEDIAAIVEDYTSYCRDTHLINEADFLMRIVPTGTSFDLNRKYAMYFHPSDRGYSLHAYIGFYTDKAVRSMIKTRSVFDVNYEYKQLKKTHVSGDDTPAFDAGIIAMIAEARQKCQYEIATGHRFFCADKAFATSFTKTTPRGILGARFADLRDYGVEDFSNTAAIAKFLKTRTWK